MLPSSDVNGPAWSVGSQSGEDPCSDAAFAPLPKSKIPALRDIRAGALTGNPVRCALILNLCRDGLGSEQQQILQIVCRKQLRPCTYPFPAEFGIVHRKDLHAASFRISHRRPVFERQRNLGDDCSDSGIPECSWKFYFQFEGCGAKVGKKSPPEGVRVLFPVFQREGA